MSNPIIKLFQSVSSVGSFVGDSVEGVLDLGSESKKFLDEEIQFRQDCQRMENAKDRILARAQHIKEIAEALNISMEEAKNLLDQEMEKD